jgi:serine-type D-Ala-D-Ala carboxypeptidase/endopeptidase (penicillin-binding protein 4)
MAIENAGEIMVRKAATVSGRLLYWQESIFEPGNPMTEILFLSLCLGTWAFADPTVALPQGIRLGPYDKVESKAVAEVNPKLLQLRKKVEAVFPRGVLGKLDVSILAYSTDKNEVLLDLSGDKLVIPASVSKLFTAYTALKKLKATSTFETVISVQGLVLDGRLAGDIFIKGGGDPSLVSERLWMLVNELTRSGIKKISGDIVADDTYFDQERTPDTRPSYLTDQAYNAPIGALSFNFNTTTIYVKPAEKVGLPPVVYTDPENSYVDVVNQATTGRADSKNTLQVKRTEFVKGDIGDTVLLRGSMPTDQKEMRFYRNIVNPSLYAAHMFKVFWEQRGLRLDGKIREGSVPAKARQVLRFESLPMWQIVWGMNKFSNNFVADQILKKVGAEVWGQPGTIDKGVKALEDALEGIGIPRKTYTIIDGSGLTRKTRVTARQIVKVLASAASDLAIAPEFTASLGVGGEDGTLRNRFPAELTRSTIRGKTGSLDGVNALAGYMETKDKENIAFAIILNDPGLRYGRMSAWVDKVALEFNQFSRK